MFFFGVEPKRFHSGKPRLYRLVVRAESRVGPMSFSLFLVLYNEISGLAQTGATIWLRKRRLRLLSGYRFSAYYRQHMLRTMVVWWNSRVPLYNYVHIWIHSEKLLLTISSKFIYRLDKLCRVTCLCTNILGTPLRLSIFNSKNYDEKIITKNSEIIGCFARLMFGNHLYFTVTYDNNLKSWSNNNFLRDHIIK